MTEARLEDAGSGLAPVTEGWFVVKCATRNGSLRRRGGAAGVILMVGAHVSPEVRYPVSQLAARYGASVAKETSDPEQVHATAERFRRERPPYWSCLPWS